LKTTRGKERIKEVNN
jgi:hypothetical protein